MDPYMKSSAPQDPNQAPPPPYTEVGGPYQFPPGGEPGTHRPQYPYPPQQQHPHAHYPGHQPHPQVPLHPAPMAQPAVVIQAPVLTTYASGFRDVPVATSCPRCGTSIVTETSFVPGALSWILCLVLFFLGLVCGCCLIPFCVHSLMDVVHSCPNCRCMVAKHNRL